MPYNADADPLIQRIRQRSQKSRFWVVIVLVAVGYVMWLYQDRLPFQRVGSDSARASGNPTLISGTSAPLASVEGPYQFHWTPGQRMFYGISCQVEGVGTPALSGPNGLSMGFDADVCTSARMMDGNSSAEIALTFADVNMYGNHFGRPVDLRRRAGMTQDVAPLSVAPVETAMNKKFDPPDISVFDDPIYAIVSDNGVLQEIESAAGFSEFFATVVRLSGTRFPQTTLHVGDTWDTTFELAFPGLSKTVPVHVQSTLTQEGVYAGRNCAQIEQVVSPAHTGGAKGLLKAISGPRIDIEGDVITYFDLDYGKIVMSEADLLFSVNIKSGLKPAAKLLGTYASLLDEVEGGPTADLNSDIPFEPGFQVTVVLMMK